MRSLIIALVVPLAACGGGSRSAPVAAIVVPPAPAPAPPPPPPPVLIESELDPPYASAPRPALAEACVRRRAGVAAGSKTKTYDFAPIEIPAVTYGPRIRDLPPTSLPRSPSTLAAMIAAEGYFLHTCYRWARWKRPELQGAMSVAIDVGPYGTVDRIDIADRAAWGELATCVVDAIATSHARRFVPRRTRFAATIQFTLSGQAAPVKRPSRPATASPRPAASLPRKPPASCVDAPLDELAWIPPVVTIDDFDEAQADRERQLAECKRTGARRCRIILSTRHLHWGSRPTVTGDLNKSIIRAYLGYNRGAFSACWAEATARQPAVGGEVNLVAEIHPDGTSTAVAVQSSTSADPTLDECLRASLAEVRFPAAATAPLITIHLPLIRGAVAPVPAPAGRDTIANVEATARAALEAGDAVTALRRYAALAGHEPSSCQRRVDVLRALVAARPWIDEVVMAAAADLVATAPTGVCALALAPILIRLAGAAHRMGLTLESPELLEIAVARYQLALRVAELPGADEVRTYLADALRRTGRAAEAAALLPEGIDAAVPRGGY